MLASITAEINVVGARMAAAFDSLVGIEVALGDAGGGGGNDNPSAHTQRVAEYWRAVLAVADVSLKALQAQAEETLQVIDATVTVQQQVMASVTELEVMLKQQQQALAAALKAIEGSSGAAAAGTGDATPGGVTCEHRDSRGVARVFFNATKYSYLGSPPPSPAPPPIPPPPLNAAGRRLLLHQEGSDTTEKDSKDSNLLALVARLLGMGPGSTRDEAAEAEAEVEAAAAGPRRNLLRSSSGGSTGSGTGSTSSGDSSSSGGPESMLSWRGYELVRGGPPQYLPPPSLIARRYIANTNKLMGGMLLHQAGPATYWGGATSSTPHTHFEPSFH